MRALASASAQPSMAPQHPKTASQSRPPVGPRVMAGSFWTEALLTLPAGVFNRLWLIFYFSETLCWKCKFLHGSVWRILRHVAIRSDSPASDSLPGLSCTTSTRTLLKRSLMVNLGFVSLVVYIRFLNSYHGICFSQTGSAPPSRSEPWLDASLQEIYPAFLSSPIDKSLRKTHTFSNESISQRKCDRWKETAIVQENF